MKKLFLTTTLCVVTVLAIAQEKKVLTTDLYDNWNSIQRNTERISDDGKWVAYEVKPGKGDGNLYVVNPSTKKEEVYNRGTHPHFSPSNEFVAFSIHFTHDSITQLKLDGKKPKEVLKDSLGVYVIGKETTKFPNVKSFAVPKNGSNWMAYWFAEEKDKDKVDAEADSTSTEEDSTSVEVEEPKAKAKKKDHKTFTLAIYQPTSRKTHTFQNVSEYSFSDNGKLVGFISLFGDSIDSTSVHVFDTEKQKMNTLLNTGGIAKGISPNYEGTQAAFLFTADTSKRKMYALHHWDGKNQKAIIDSSSAGMPKGWNVNTNSKLVFSENGTRLFFGTTEKPEPYFEDTIPKDEKTTVDVWSWTDKQLIPMQQVMKPKEEKRTYLAVYDLKQKKMFQLADEQIKTVHTREKGNNKLALGVDDTPYGEIGSWEQPEFNDYYIINIATGEKRLIFKNKQNYSVELSPKAKYITWWNIADSSWYAYEIATGAEKNISAKAPVNFYDEQNDIPMEAYAYPTAGWTENDGFFIVNDFYDLWKLGPNGKKAPINITNGYGRKNNMRFRYYHFDEDDPTIKENIVITGKVYQNNAEAYYKCSTTKAANPTKLYGGDFGISPQYISFGRQIYSPTKARDANAYLWRQYSFKDYYDIWYTSNEFKTTKRVSNANPQINQYKWGSVEYVEWKSYQGRDLNGLLYKPEDFDPNKKYPMLVYFYERMSEMNHYHAGMTPSTSTIRPAHYTSNGYVIFMPDIVYTTGHPGKDAYDCIVSGTEHIEKMGFIDGEKIGLQGQSWGGYQTAQLITMTDKYAAAMAGAPVSNMTSAYGGIRWGSGMSRMFQYEVTQSRIGGTLWEKFDLYKENSPVFFADKVKTPLLIMHNDKDGAVPWYQGIEYFVALRRLNKPVWMLNYSGDDHNLLQYPNRVDLSIRMKQFFDHYLMDKPMPKWMKEGVPYIKKGKEYGYELIEE